MNKSFEDREELQGVFGTPFFLETGRILGVLDTPMKGKIVCDFGAMPFCDALKCKDKSVRFVGTLHMQDNPSAPGLEMALMFVRKIEILNEAPPGSSAFDNGGE